MRLNVGCGEFYAPGWINLDTGRDDQRHPDLIGTLLDLPPQVQGVTAVYLGHVLEHLPHENVVPALTALRTRLVPGAAVMTVGPDILRAQVLHDQGRLDAVTLAACGTGGLRWDGDRHYWACHEALLVEALTLAGYEQVTPIPVLNAQTLAPWPVTSYAPWQCAVTATNPQEPITL